MTTKYPMISLTDWYRASGRGMVESLLSGFSTRARTAPVTATSWPTISMYYTVLDSLRNLGWDGREEGGWLTGYSSPPNDNEREILTMHRASDEWESSRTRTSLFLDRAASILEGLPADQGVVGCFHSHPPNESTTPSQVDIDSWGGLVEQFGRSEWIGVIVSERQDARGYYNGAEVSAYLVRRQSGALVHRKIEISTWSY